MACHLSPGAGAHTSPRHPLDVANDPFVLPSHPLSDVIYSGDLHDDVIPAVKPLPPVSESVGLDVDVHSIEY